MAAKKNKGTPKPLGVHIIFGENGKFFGKNMTANFKENRIGLVEAIYKK